MNYNPLSTKFAYISGNEINIDFPSILINASDGQIPCCRRLSKSELATRFVFAEYDKVFGTDCLKRYYKLCEELNYGN